MRAVNLIPGDAPGAPRGGLGVAALLGGLAVLLALVTAHVLIGNQIADRQSELASAQQAVATVQAQADATRPYREFASLAKARVETIRQLGTARFDWHRAFADLSVVIPGNVWLSSLTGTVTAGVNVAGGGGGGSADGLRAAIPSPAITMTGCTTDHDSVARLISRLRLMHGVQRVALGSSSKDGGGGDCQHGHTKFPVFSLVVFFDPIPAVQAPAQAQAAGTPAAATSGATPAAAGAPAPAAASSSGTTSGTTATTPAPTATPASTPPKVVGNG